MSTEDTRVKALPRMLALLGGAAVTALVLDIVTKVAVVANLEGRQPVRVAGGLLYLQVIRNPGAAFSMATGMTWLLTLITMVVIGFILWVGRRLRSAGWSVGLGLVLGGALGNLTDRLFRSPGPLQGHVVDFLSVFGPNGSKWPVFNVADSSICVGGALIVLMALSGRDYDGQAARTAKDAAPGETPEKTADTAVDRAAGATGVGNDKADSRSADIRNGEIA